ncbi:MAG: phosphatase PAP2 family protein [Myxococcota bacterium]
MTTLRRLLAYDQALLLRVHRWQRPWITRVMSAATHLADPQSWVVLGVALAASGTPTGEKLALRLAWGAGGAALVAQLIKRLSRRSRPDAGIADFKALAVNPDAYSFPSGHTAATVAVAVAWTGQGNGLGGLAAALSALVGFSRVYLGAHYPLDVFAGALLGTALGAAARVVVP